MKESYLLLMKIEFLINCIVINDGTYSIYWYSPFHTGNIINDEYKFTYYHRTIDFNSIINKNISDTDITTKRFYEKITELGYKILMVPKSYECHVSITSL